MLSKKIEEALNKQLNFEIESAHIYLAMSGYFGDLGLDGFKNFFDVQYEEELAHAKKFMNFIIEKGGRVNITGFESPKNDYESIMEVFKISLEHEREVTARIYDLVDLTKEEREHSTESFLQWFVDEQVEEEATFEDIINKLKLLDGVGTYLLDRELAERTLEEIAE
ncbi:ferritin [Haloplasma contractile]|uniref:Ferritin n=1 Tax=Haloplasma contractile SSD-17B TaxID=1033810 RepID=U2FRU0_9MOLU|nr:ferritin [Haloplasma contractile]ERJ13679.1 Ferritin-like protein [Haloplasma contractile SSD-17B]